MRKPRRLKHEINVVPYIDVMLVLLVIFMVTAPMIQPGSIELPSVGKMSAPPSEALVVTIESDGEMSIPAPGGSRTVGRLELAEHIKTLKVKHPDQSVLIAGDKNAKYDAILKVLDDLQAAQVKVSLQVRSK